MLCLWTREILWRYRRKKVCAKFQMGSEEALTKNFLILAYFWFLITVRWIALVKFISTWNLRKISRRYLTRRMKVSHVPYWLSWLLYPFRKGGQGISTFSCISLDCTTKPSTLPWHLYVLPGLFCVVCEMYSYRNITVSAL